MFQKKHILVIDDDEKLRQLLKSFLFGQGYLVDTSEDTHTARIKMSNILYDLIILDVMLPRESGISFAEKCKNIINIPILMLSAMSEVEDRIKGLKTGVDELGRTVSTNELAVHNVLWSDVLVKIKEVESLEYREDRRRAYPDMGVQLDYIYHNGIDKWKTDIVDPVKAKYPKPS